MSDDNTRTVTDATCTFCGCVCDDITLSVDVAQHKITKSQNACVLGKAWFEEHGIEERPFALIGGREATTEEGVEEAARIRAEARYPIIYGLSDTTCEAQRVAVSIADMIGGNLDTTTSVCHGPTGMAFQNLGESTASLGEIKNRADLIIFWGGNPAEAHPRLFTRYAVTPKGMYTPNGRKDRTVALVTCGAPPARRWQTSSSK
jgi:formylmethanofuran dehydrogenase subunit B